MAAGLQLTFGGARGGQAERGSFYPGYELSKLEIAEPTLYYVDKNYVDPTRIDWDAMFDAGLDAVERRVPRVLFTRAPGGRTLAVEIGAFRSVVDVAPIDDLRSLQEQLRSVATLLEEHLDPDDIPGDGRPPLVPLAEVEYALVNGMLSTLDPHTLLLEPEDAREMDMENQGEFGGLGITIELDGKDRQLTVKCTLDGAPAALSGIRSEDRLMRIDGESTLNMSLDEAVSRLRGSVGVPIVLDVLHEGAAEPVSVEVLRDLIPARPVESELLQGNVGWVRISGFHEKVEHDLVDALSSLHRDAGGDLRGLVLDLRGNPGGYLNQAVRVADTFLDSGDIVSTVDGRGQKTEPPETANRAAEPQYPLVVLVDASSASASEIVAGALRYNERAVIVGERTFGKGSVQNLHPFFDDSKLKLTISRYLSPGERSLQAVGVPADIELVPSIVPTDPDQPAHLFHREHLRREADLDRALEATLARVDDPPFTARYLEPERNGGCDTGPDLERDPELQLARDLIMSAGTAWRRPDVLAAASPVVSSHGKGWNAAIVSAFSQRGVDWQDGPGWPRGEEPPALDVTVVVGEGSLVAGEESELSVTVTNRTDRSLWRVAAVARGSDLLEGEELFFGKLAPGATATASVRVDVPAGWPAEEVPASLVFRDAGRGDLSTTPLDVKVDAAPMPAFATSWTLTDADGDGRLSAGEELALDVKVTNVGDGRARSPYVRLRNRSGKAVELREAAFEPLSPSGAEGLLPGESASGVLHLQVATAPSDGGPALVMLEVGDMEAVDRGAWLRRSVSTEAGQSEGILLSLDEPLPAPSGVHRSPEIAITRVPALRAGSGRVTLSGMVEDDGAIEDVMVFAGSDKVFLETGGEGLTSLPFTADIDLQPGENIVSIVARDADGFVSTRSLVTWAGETAELAQATPDR
ncbi:MAG: PDZ domain-containing protein [Alphaproteobacteria bacterium]|nr:PDZ domain-containing protein [Alphaproteobacteria bacterium]MCB9697847.1 PDZ domain-containing protein [Alphaproteobacteria bacterium]